MLEVKALAENNRDQPPENNILSDIHCQEAANLALAGYPQSWENDRLSTIMDTIRKSRVHRMVVIDETNHLKGIVTLSDILHYILLDGEEWKALMR